MAKISRSDMSLIDDVFQMGTGYVLNFSDRTFAEFFDDEFSIDIDDARYKVNGTSKAKRLRTLLRATEPPLVGHVLSRLLEHRLLLDGNIRPEVLAHVRRLFERLSTESSATQSAPAPAYQGTNDLYDGLSRQLGFLLEATSGNVFHWSKLPQHSKLIAEQMPRLRELSDSIKTRTCKLTVLQEKTIVESAHESAALLPHQISVAYQVSGGHGNIWSSLSKTVSQLAKLYPFRTQAATNVARSIVVGQDGFSLHFCELVEQLLQFETMPRPKSAPASRDGDPVANGVKPSNTANPAVNEGTEFPATVVFVLLEGLKECTDGLKIPNALAALNDALRDVDPEAFVLSTIAGLIVVLPDSASLDLDNVWALLDDAPSAFRSESVSRTARSRRWLMSMGRST